MAECAAEVCSDMGALPQPCAWGPRGRRRCVVEEVEGARGEGGAWRRGWRGM
jgi:hypothetical protein